MADLLDDMGHFMLAGALETSAVDDAPFEHADELDAAIAVWGDE